jgi:hypothetical protein
VLTTSVPSLALESKRLKTEEVEFVGVEGNKTLLRVGRVAEKVGGLLDRDETIQQLYEGCTYLASKRSTKNDVPVLALSAASESGKTEMDFQQLLYLCPGRHSEYW